MKSRPFLLVTLCSFLLSPDVHSDTMQDIIKIAPYGNSITQADGSHQSYRYPLWKKLIDANIAFDFVGTMNTNFSGNPNRPDYKGKRFDADHEGHWGWRVDQILQNINNWLNQYTPDMVLMHLGTNDCIQGQTISETLNEIKQIIEKLRNDNPSVVIFMANLIPCNAQGTPPRITEINNRIKPLAEELTSESSPIIFVDQYSGINSSELYDGIHPNAVGEEKMATKWFDAIDGYLASTRTKNIAPFARVSSQKSAYRIELVCSPDGHEWSRKFSRSSPVIDLMGKRMGFDGIEQTRTNRVYIIQGNQ
ncbi:MAG: cellulose-binding protein [Fibrobacter sp.]|nr:cellulose-binding protein [Fibrobacter sp.]